MPPTLTGNNIDTRMLGLNTKVEIVACNGMKMETKFILHCSISCKVVGV